MKDYIETAYEDVCTIIMSSMDDSSRSAALASLSMRLGDASAELENMFFERLGISLGEAAEIFGMGALLP
ncbi:MAG: hypothetical protein IJ971_04030 [Bacteroidales bacterium]|nr:hypothetical protein [Bacteroidales bacterium]